MLIGFSAKRGSGVAAVAKERDFDSRGTLKSFIKLREAACMLHGDHYHIVISMYGQLALP